MVQTRLHPVHAVLLAGTLPLFLGAMLSDIAYSTTFEVQWKNFASWLIVGGLFFAGFTMIAAIIRLLRRETRTAWAEIYFGFLLVIFVLGFINALVHAADAWASMPTGLALSVVIVLLALLATAMGFFSYRKGAVQ